VSQHESEAEERLRQELRQYLAGLAEQASLAPEMRERIRTIPTRHPLDTQGESQTHPIESKDQLGNWSQRLLMNTYHDWLLMCARLEYTRMKGKAGANRFSEREGAPRRDIEEADSTHQLARDLMAHISNRLTEEEKTLIYAMSDRDTDKAMPDVKAIADLMGVSVASVYPRLAHLRRKIWAIRKALQQFSLGEE
jgi:hypothetical protein